MLSSVFCVVSQSQTGTGYGISASGAPGAASGSAEAKVTQSHEATKIPSLRGFVASCEKTTGYLSETGEIVASYSYDAFGRTIAQSGPMVDAFPFRFSTKYYDSETGLYYYGRRYYSPDLSRWLNRDPIEEEGGVNLYAFCGNNGVCAVDALGLFVLNIFSDNSSFGDAELWEAISQIDGSKTISGCTSKSQLFKILEDEVRNHGGELITELNLSGHGISNGSGVSFLDNSPFDLGKLSEDEIQKLKSFLGQYGKITLWSCDSAKSKQQCRRLDDAAKKLYVEIHAKDDMVRSGPDLGAWLDRFAIRFVNAISFWSKSD